MTPSFGPATWAALVFAGFTAGFVDSIAGGGGLITLPSLMALGLPPHLALGTNKGQAVFGAISSAASFYRRGEMDTGRAPVGFAMGFAGSVLGAALLLRVRPEPLRPIVLGLLVAVALLLVFRDRAKPRVAALRYPRWTLAGIALGLGFYDGFFGPGVGSMLIVAFAMVFGDGLTRASGNAKVVNLASNLAAVTLFAYRGTVLWSVALPMALANAVGAFTGARVAVRRGDPFVRVVVLIVVVALVMKIGFELICRPAAFPAEFSVRKLCQLGF